MGRGVFSKVSSFGCQLKLYDTMNDFTYLLWVFSRDILYVYITRVGVTIVLQIHEQN